MDALKEWQLCRLVLSQQKTHAVSRLRVSLRWGSCRGATQELWLPKGFRNLWAHPIYLAILTAHCTFKPPCPLDSIKCYLGAPVQITSGAHVLLPSLHSQVLNIPANSARMCLPKIPSLSPFWNVPLSQHIQVCVLVISAHVYSLLLTIKLWKKGILSYLFLYFQKICISSC